MKKEHTIQDYIIQNDLDIIRIIEDYDNYIRTIIKNTHSLSIEDEEEVLADVFFIVWKNKNKLQTNLKFSPYIAGITKRVIYRKYEQLNKNISCTGYEEEFIDKFDIDDLIEQKEMNDYIIKNLKEIGQTEYEIFTKFYYEGKKVKQIAKEVNLTASNVKTKLHRTRKKIKQILQLGGF